MKPYHRTALARAISTICLLGITHAYAAESPSTSTLPRISVSADEEAALEDSPYRTGGDVNIVTRAEIESAHYNNITEAIRRIPGVQVSGPGYRACEYTFTFCDQVSINGDDSVIIMVDGRRLDNDANSYGPATTSSATSKSRVPLDVITSIYNVERIEVIKGTGGVAYGADATGGVINIITRKGTDDHEGAVNVGFGSWGKENYALTQAGSFGDRSFRYFLSASHQKSDDTRYKDAYLDDTVTYTNTRYKDDGASLNLSKEFTANQELRLQWSWTDGKAHYPITAPDYERINLFYNSQQPNSSTTLGYRNWFLYDAWLGSYTAERSNDVNLRYIFNKANGTESYISAYRNHRRYTSRDYSDLFGIQYGDITPADVENALLEAGNRKTETVDGVDLQLARTFSRHGLMAGGTYRESEYEAINIQNSTSSFVNRDRTDLWLQDKMALTDRWTFTPGVRYSDYTEIERKTATGFLPARSGTDKVTFAAYTNYETGLLGDIYASWAQIFRPKTNNDYSAESPLEPLFDETGDSWTIGLRKRFGDNTAVDVNYAVTDMSNVIKRYRVPSGNTFVNRAVNATAESEAFNLGVDHRFNDDWGAKVSYAYVMEDFRAKNYVIDPLDGTNVNALINRFRPANKYQADVQYTGGQWDASVYAELSTGMSTRYFTDDRFLVFGMSVNYDLFQSTRLYVTAENLTNEAWENKAHPVYGPGAFPQPARSFMVGLNQKF